MADRITDFAHDMDAILLNIPGLGGPLAASAFKVIGRGTDDFAHVTAGQIVDFT